MEYNSLVDQLNKELPFLMLVLFTTLMTLFLSKILRNYIKHFSNLKDEEMLIVKSMSDLFVIFKQILKINHDSVDEILSPITDSVTKRIIKILEKSEKIGGPSKNEKIKSLSIVGLFAIKRSKSNVISSLSVLFALIANILISIYLTHSDIVNPLSIIFFIVLLIIAVDEYILFFRIKKGYYGTNKHEAREIINFIISNSNGNDYKGPDGKIKIFENILNESNITESEYNKGFNNNPSLT